MCTKLPELWIADVVVLEGMFTLNTTPLSTHSVMKEYALFLLQRFVINYFSSGTNQVHIVFDNPGRPPNTPKAFERKRRDCERTVSSHSDHKHMCFSDACAIPSNWRDCISCRTCTQALVLYLGECFFRNALATCTMKHYQQFIVAGYDDIAREIEANGANQIHELRCNAEEADTRVWLHALKSEGPCKLLCSSDIDVYHIGLPLIPCESSEVYIRVSMFYSPEHRYLSMNKLLSAIQNDSDLAFLPKEQLAKVLQVLFISTGCDYLSYFSGLGKSTFLKVFFQLAEFISGTSVGTLADTYVLLIES